MPGSYARTTAGCEGCFSHLVSCFLQVLQRADDGQARPDGSLVEDVDVGLALQLAHRLVLGQGAAAQLLVGGDDVVALRMAGEQKEASNIDALCPQHRACARSSITI